MYLFGTGSHYAAGTHNNPTVSVSLELGLLNDVHLVSAPAACTCGFEAHTACGTRDLTRVPELARQVFRPRGHLSSPTLNILKDRSLS